MQVTNCTCQQALLKYIDSISLVLVDVCLYLDTHPCDEDALGCFHHFKALLKDAKQEYVENYGPLRNSDVNCENYWTWINDPWPWEQEGLVYVDL